MKKETFAIKSKQFSLLQAIKKEAEKMGWTYNSTFNEWSEKRLISRDSDCLCFATSWMDPFMVMKETGPQMSLSTHGKSKCYNLPEDWNEAIKALEIPKEEKEAPKEDAKVSIEEIEAAIDGLHALFLLALLSKKLKNHDKASSN